MWLVEYAKDEPVDTVLLPGLIWLFRDRIFGGHRLGEYGQLLGDIYKEIGAINVKLDNVTGNRGNSDADEDTPSL